MKHIQTTLAFAAFAACLNAQTATEDRPGSTAGAPQLPTTIVTGDDGGRQLGGSRGATGAVLGGSLRIQAGREGCEGECCLYVFHLDLNQCCLRSGLWRRKVGAVQSERSLPFPTPVSTGSGSKGSFLCVLQGSVSDPDQVTPKEGAQKRSMGSALSISNRSHRLSPSCDGADVPVARPRERLHLVGAAA